jgi:hypothetical protein
MTTTIHCVEQCLRENDQIVGVVLEWEQIPVPDASRWTGQNSQSDAGSNPLRYNIHNWEFDWNWYVSFVWTWKTGLLTGAAGISIVTWDNYASVFTEQLAQLKKDKKGERRDDVEDALRRTFLKLNRQLRKMSQVSFFLPPTRSLWHHRGLRGRQNAVCC